MTLANFYSTVRQIIGSSDTVGASQPSEHTDAELGELYEAVTREWFELARPRTMVKLETVNQNNGTAEEDAPAKALVVLRVWVTIGGVRVSTRASSRELLELLYGPTWATQAAGTPTHWHDAGLTAAGGRRIGLVPPPNATVSNGLAILNVNRPATVSEISTGSIVDIPEALQKTLAEDVAIRILERPDEIGQVDPEMRARVVAGRELFKIRWGYEVQA